MSEGFLLVLSGPSGSGKGTVCNRLMDRNKDVVFSVSTTTRGPREGEVDGKNYFFIDEDEFKEMVKRDEFLEHARVHNNYYGTPKDFVVEEIDKGDIVLLEIDVQGAMQVKDNYENAVFVFLLPPSMKELENRIVNRGTETKEDIETRLKNAYRELDYLENYDYFLINDDIDQAVVDIESIIKAERLKIERNKNIKEEIIGEDE